MAFPGSSEAREEQEETQHRRHSRGNHPRHHRRSGQHHQHPHPREPPPMRPPLPPPHQQLMEGMPLEASAFPRLHLKEQRPHAEIPPMHAPGNRPPLFPSPGMPHPRMTSPMRHPPPHLLNQGPGMLGPVPAGLSPAPPPRPGLLEHEAGLRPPGNMLMQHMLPNQARLPPHSLPGGQLLLNPALLPTPGMRANLLPPRPPPHTGAPVVSGQQNPLLEPRLPLPLDMRPGLLAPDGSPVSEQQEIMQNYLMFV